MRFQIGIHCRKHYLLVVVEKMRNIRDNKGDFDAVLTHHFKAFGCIPHGIQIAKLNAVGFDKKPLSFISDYLHKRKQKAR